MRASKDGRIVLIFILRGSPKSAMRKHRVARTSGGRPFEWIANVVALRGREIDAFLARPDPGRPIILLYGPDAGLVRERADALLASAVDDPTDPFSLVRLDGDVSESILEPIKGIPAVTAAKLLQLGKA